MAASGEEVGCDRFAVGVDGASIEEDRSSSTQSCRVYGISGFISCRISKPRIESNRSAGTCARTYGVEPSIAGVVDI